MANAVALELPKKRPAERARNLLIAAATVLVWLRWIGWPLPAAAGLDPSWQLVLGYAHAHQWQFGRDLVFTHGPWSFLNVSHCYPGTFWPLVGWQLLFKGLVAGAVGYSAIKLCAWRASLLLVAAALLLPLFEDVAPVLMIIFIVWRITGNRRLSLFLLLPATALLAFLALQKFTYCVMVTAAVGGTMTLLFLTRRPRDAVAFGLGVGASLCVFWLAPGQRLGALPVFLYRDWQLASLYSETMFIDETPEVFWCGMITALTAGIAIALAIRREQSWSPSARLAAAALGYAFAFLIWKQGFVRADGHVQVFFLCALGTGLIFRPAGSGLALALAALLGLAVSSPELLLRAPVLFRLRLTTSIRALSSPLEQHRQFDAETAAARAAAELPKIRERVGQQAVDVFGDDQTAAILNALSYRSRPVFQTHQAYSSALAELNAKFYAAPGAPEYVLLRLQTVDDRFLPADDARTLVMLLQGYRPVVEENGWRLLQRQPGMSRESFTPIRSEKVRLGASISVPQRRDLLVLAAIDLHPKALGQLRTFFYKSAEVRLTVNDGVVARSYRLIIPAARGGFLVAPLLRDQDDYQDLLDGSGKRAARTLTVDVAPAMRKYYREKLSVEFAESPFHSVSGEKRRNQATEFADEHDHSTAPFAW